MKAITWTMLAGIGVLAVVAGRSAISADAPTPINISQRPLFVQATRPPLNMLVMGKDHKIYYEAYNDASDLNGDGVLDVGYKPEAIDYYGYYNSNVCYNYDSSAGGRFVPSSATTNKQCSSKWSGDFLNYLTTSRMDALRRVLYGGWRQVDSGSDTTLQGAFFPQDGHSWGKEYKSTAESGFDIAKYAPLGQPTAGRYHLFAVTTVTGNDATFASGYTAPIFRVMQNSSARVWNWLSIEGPVAGNKCFTASNQRVDCLAGGTAAFPGHPGSRGEFDAMETQFATSANRLGSSEIDKIDCRNSNCNPFGEDDNYLTIIEGELDIEDGRGNGDYQFRVDGDDVVDFELTGSDGVTARAGCYSASGRGFGACAGNEMSAVVKLKHNQTYRFKFRHEEATGGDGYKLEWRKISGGHLFDWRVITSNDADSGGNGELDDVVIKTYDLRRSVSGASRVDYNVRVQVCAAGSAALNDASCKLYPSGNFKPTGILHDYGESEKMYFGLITGSQFNNLQGGVLRKNISNFAEEINAADGTFKAGVGIANTLSRLRMIGGAYGGGTTNNLNADSNWSWAGGTGNCPSVGDRSIVNGECRMWGNPIAEMMFEGMRYFAGAAAATARFSTGGATQGHAEETTMGLSQDTWKDPYVAAGGFSSCARPFQTVISDINPSYDSGLPGSAFDTAIAADSSVAGFNASGQGSAIWNHEFGAGARNVFIGQVGATTDGAPTAKSASSFGDIRGLSPEEPTKGGTYYAASVARYGYLNDLNPRAAGDQKLGVYAIALASPLPKIEFPINGRMVTILPFAKTASGTFGGGTQKPTNTIVDFYVESIANLDPSQQINSTINGGRPEAVFRISYEDVEQGNDHDMDAIAKYTIKANSNGTISVEVISEYAAGSADQNMGYVLSGTTADGIYLVVRDTDSNATSFRPYSLNTPPGVDPGGCHEVITGVCNQQLPLTSSRSFTPSQTAAAATQLKNPLWYAAKYGGFNDANGNGIPDSGEWDSNVPGEPDNYFLVTNPLQLRAQLTKAFDAIQAQADQSTGALTVNGARLGAASFTVAPSFSILDEGRDWVGDLKAYQISGTGNAGGLLWSAGDKIGSTAASSAARKIFTSVGPVQASNRAVQVVPFLAASIGGTTDAQFQALGYSQTEVANIFGAFSPNQLVGYLRGNAALEGAQKGSLPFRKRSSRLGDIINSTPQVSTGKDNFGWGTARGLTVDVRNAYTTFLGSTGKGARPNYVFVGANDGMLHAFDASTAPCAAPATGVCATSSSGSEVFAYIPNSVLNKMGSLADPDYQHRYFVDGSISVTDAHNGSAWRTVLTAASGAGGKGVFGLDVTTPAQFDATKVLWEVNGSTALHGNDVGFVMGTPVVVPLDDGRWVSIFGNGYNSKNGKAALFVVDAFSGVVLEKLVVEDSVSGMNGLGHIAAIDTDSDGLVDTVYGADFHGNVWRFGFGSSAPFAASVSFDGKPLFVARAPDGTRQPITSGLEVSAGPGNGSTIFFGTGSYFQESDHSIAAGQQIQSLYGIWDNGSPIEGARDSILQKQTITSQTLGSPNTRTSSQSPVNYSTKRGWVLDLVVGTDALGERFIGAPRLQNGKVFFTTFVPLGDQCIPGGRNWLFSLDALTGAAGMTGVSLDPSGDPPVCTGADCAAIGISDGAPVRDTSVIIPPLKPVPGLVGGCIPGTPGCDAPATAADVYQQCTLIIRAAGAPPLYLPRPCGRQSWRQVK